MSLGDPIQLLIYLLVIFAILGIAWWALSQIPLPQPFRIIAVVVMALIAIVVLLKILPGV